MTLKDGACIYFECPLNTFKNEETIECESCFDMCTSCIDTSETGCTGCIAGAMMHGGICQFCTDVEGFQLSSTGVECEEICGDGLRITEQHECDDGNTIAGDGCSPLCRIEYGYKCVRQGGKDICTENINPLAILNHASGAGAQNKLVLSFSEEILIVDSRSMKENIRVTIDGMD